MIRVPGTALGPSSRTIADNMLNSSHTPILFLRRALFHADIPIYKIIFCLLMVLI